jgi:6-phosphogluconolactonase/glucosamine-6-phosphate isomerase/deaminase
MHTHTLAPGTIEGEATVDVPASFMKEHGNTTLFLDENSASLLSK